MVEPCANCRTTEKPVKFSGKPFGLGRICNPCWQRLHRKRRGIKPRAPKKELGPYVVDPLEHIGLVHSIARQFRSTPFDYDDLVGWGTIGLVNACRGYKPIGWKFSSYATRAIRCAILLGITRDGLLIRPAEGVANPRVSFVDDLIVAWEPDDDAEETAHQAHAVASVLDALRPIESTVLKLKYGIGCEPHTFVEIGKSLNFSKTRAQQIYARAMERARQHLEVA